MFSGSKNSEKINYMESNISSQMVQVPLFSYLTLTFISKVIVLVFDKISEYLVNGER